MNDQSEYGLLLPFDDESESFTLGFEAGRIETSMRLGEIEVVCTVHSANHDIILRMADLYGYSCQITETEFDEWIELSARKLNPTHGLTSN